MSICLQDLCGTFIIGVMAWLRVLLNFVFISKNEETNVNKK